MEAPPPHSRHYTELALQSSWSTGYGGQNIDLLLVPHGDFSCSHEPRTAHDQESMRISYTHFQGDSRQISLAYYDCCMRCIGSRLASVDWRWWSSCCSGVRLKLRLVCRQAARTDQAHTTFEIQRAPFASNSLKPTTTPIDEHPTSRHHV